MSTFMCVRVHVHVCVFGVWPYEHHTLLTGSAADICKAALVNLFAFIKSSGSKAFVVGQLHDEIIVGQ
eukprot:m.198922 g.198922  ORF g.198922 m.198922 type:complete len:68 (-) comp13691_c0_seq12:238-441(-)